MSTILRFEMECKIRIWTGIGIAFSRYRIFLRICTIVHTLSDGGWQLTHIKLSALCDKQAVFTLLLGGYTGLLMLALFLLIR